MIKFWLKLVACWRKCISIKWDARELRGRIAWCVPTPWGIVVIAKDMAFYSPSWPAGWLRVIPSHQLILVFWQTSEGWADEEILKVKGLYLLPPGPEGTICVDPSAVFHRRELRTTGVLDWLDI